MSTAVQPRPAGPPPALAEALESGLTSRTWPVILYGAFILMPANIYLMLVAGQSLLGPISFIALILWVEAARLSRKPLSTAEAFIVYSVSAVAAGQMLFYMYAIYPAYFRISEISNSTLFSFKDPVTGAIKTFGEAAPAWWAPPREVVLQRSFLHKEWILPLLVGAASWVCHMLADLSMGVLGRELFVKVEKLPFPYAQPPAEACKALTRNDPEAKKVFTVCGLVGTVWGLIIYFPVALGKKIIDFPIPWADFNHSLHSVLRGASFGVAMDILAFTGGFIVPLRVIVSMLIGAMAIQFFGNAWATGGLAEFLGNLGFHDIATSPAWQGIVNPATGQHYFNRYIEGMGISQILPNQLFVWMPVFIGGMVAAGLLHIFSSPRELARTFKGLLQTGRTTVSREEQTLSLLPLAILFVSSVVGAVILFRFLNPEFPWYIIAPFALFWSLLFSLIDIRAVGTTGYRIEPPYVREGLIISMHPKNINVWFAPWPVALGSSAWVQHFKTAELVNCAPRSLILAYLLAYPVGMAANLVFVSIFWSIAPIPSAVYPYAEIVLPVWANNLCIWISAAMPNASEGTKQLVSQLFNYHWMVATFGIFTAVFLLGKVFKRFALSVIGLAVGMAMPLPFAVSLFIGGMAAQYIRRKTGPEWFSVNRNIIVAGLAVGEGVVIGLFAALAALSNSLIALPY
jgi:hypothetical protein